MSKISLLKHSFFNNSTKKLDDFSFKDDDFNLNQLKLEFSSLYQLFNSNKFSLQKESEIVLYLRLLCDLLIQYYQCDYVAADLKVLLAKKKEIERFFQEDLPLERQSVPSPQFSLFLTNKIRSKAKKFIFSFKSSSKVRSYVSTVIVNRSYWNYSRTLANLLIRFALKSKLAQLIREINKAIGLYGSPEDLLRLIEISQELQRVLSFSLYVLRFMIHLIMIVKHVISAARTEELSAKKIVIQELEKRIYIMLSDLVWAIVNLLSNYNQFFGLSASFVARLNVALLAVDIVLFLLRWLIEARQYYHCIDELLLQKADSNSSLELALINRQLDILNDEWEVQCAYHLFNIAAAILLVFAFSAAIVCSGPLLLLGLGTLSMLGNALYNSCEEYKKYKQASIAVKRERLNGPLSDEDYHCELLCQLNDECEQAYNYFLKTLIFNVGFTALIITTAAISWPVAVFITASYLGYRLWDYYEKGQHKEERKELGHDIYRLFSPAQPERANLELGAENLLCSA